ncbi:penicillin-binding protein 2 [Senegalimassilia faecalis]|uniref:Penicillin-binding protein 2 n=1 Tax=Senegalimassilia faecalis TaxID=2509433 RepID=A0A4Q2JWD8_9ACTN|nr:penicillin-binding protein 2 [Senegalimassilia faecalis]RXZ53335.1 penicillin-binding protein 2 [Senegalimassilia faecalis]
MSNYQRPPRSSSGNRDRQAGRRTTSTSGRSLGQHASRSDARSAQRSGRHGASSSRESSRGRRTHQAPAPAGIAGKLAIFDSNRAFWPLAIFAIFAAVFFLRLVYLQVIVAGDYSAQAQAQRTSYLTIEPRRGTIYDRNGVVLATSVDATTIYVDPTEVTDVNMTAQLLADSLGGQASDYLEKVTANNTRYSVIKRKADTSVGDDLQSRVTERVAEAQKQENVRAKDAGEQAQTVQSGIHFVTESRREYPNGQVAGQVVGACSIGVDEDKNREYYYGICGLEKQYNDVLSGTPGYYEAEYGRSGQAIPGGVHEQVDAVDGQDIVVSIDINLQRDVEEYLTNGCKDLEAASGSAVLMDGSTGEIYAAASLPLFNPADRSEVKEGAMQLKCVTDLFEPGSIFKSVSAMAILETGTLTPDSELFCPASITADGYTISDAHERGDATFTLREILDQSSNVGISLATEQMGFDELYNHIVKYNLHSTTGVDYPGEGEEGTDALGMLAPLEQWSAVQAYNVSFGQGVSVTPLQMTRFYGAIVNSGVECVPHFLLSMPQSGYTPVYETEDVIENKDAIGDMQSMLKTVVTDGTGKLAAIDGYNVAGKTSTAEIYDEENGGYRKNVYNLAFTGFLADSSSKLVCFVGANEVPGNRVVTPIFKDIMTSAIDRFGITSE